MGPGGSMSQVVGLPTSSYKPITNTAWVRAQLCKLQKGCTRLAAASDKVDLLLAHGRWFSPGTPASSTTKAGRHDIVEILLKVALNTNIKSNQTYTIFSINLVSLVTLRSSGTDILYVCHLLLNVCIIYFISCDCIVNSSLSYTIY